MSQQDDGEIMPNVSITHVEIVGNADDLIANLPERVRDQVLEGKRAADLTQLLGLALRGVTPLADLWRNRLEGLHEENADGGIQVQIDLAKKAVSRADQALTRLANTSLDITNLTDDAFDDTFQIIFTDEVDEEY
ncbi:hypothetical protein LUCX_65 [Xanthomonas phage vB_XciM_LucasX]|nr:hypothetical protein LUCX_65 [Xanthomonas phage vB_XciM_LucasX]